MKSPPLPVRTPLRYPGGKSRALAQIMECMPPHFEDFREPFVGGGSVFLYLRQLYPEKKFWINDLNRELYLFWKICQTQGEELARDLRKLHTTTTDGRALFVELANASTEAMSDYDRAMRFFVLNRISFSGTVEAGGYSQKAFEARFTPSSIDRLEQVVPLLAGVKITNRDYRALLVPEDDAVDKPNKVFLFLDPPYYTATKSRLYGKRGILHTGFDHEPFAAALRECGYQWLITYDDCPEIRHNFRFAHIYEWELQYGMNNYKQPTAAKGKELFITNYPVSLPQLDAQMVLSLS